MWLRIDGNSQIVRFRVVFILKRTVFVSDSFWLISILIYLMKFVIIHMKIDIYLL